MEQVPGQDLPIRDISREGSPTLDVSGDDVEPPKEATPPGILVEGSLPKTVAQKSDDPRFDSPIEIELPTDPKAYRSVCNLAEIGRMPRAAQELFGDHRERRESGCRGECERLRPGDDRQIVPWRVGEGMQGCSQRVIVEGLRVARKGLRVSALDGGALAIADGSSDECSEPDRVSRTNVGR